MSNKLCNTVSSNSCSQCPQSTCSGDSKKDLQD